jgi:hypothetical protein
MAGLDEAGAAGNRGAGLQKAIDDSIAGRPTYPSGTTFIDADMEGFGACLADEARERRPIVIVYPDGEERFLVPTPRPGTARA